MNADTRKFEARLLCDKKAWKAKKGKVERPLKDRSTLELRSDGIHETIRRERGLPTQGHALKLVGTELRIRARDGNNG